MITNKKTLETKNYLQTLEDLKSKIKTAQIKAHLAVNKEMLILPDFSPKPTPRKPRLFNLLTPILKNPKVDL